MACLECGSSHQAELLGKSMLHFIGFKSVDNPGIFLSSKFLVCLDCGFGTTTVPAPELKLMAEGPEEKARSEAAGGGVPI